MSTLFSNSSLDDGYRLHYLEIFNWGTFNGKVYKLQPDGRTSLLTGANGSGKTTLIDALLTILVPSHKRFYNQSSGAESKKERDESSYFWGHYGKTFSEVDEKSKTEQLRNKADNPYSVLLACFKNESTKHTITLVQLRWFSNGSLQKEFIVAPYSLTVSENFGADHFDLKGSWKKKFREKYPKAKIHQSFKDYASDFSDHFGLKDKALSLFSQTVGIKVLGDLTNFVRQEMLEEADAEEQFLQLHRHYQDLLDSHRKILKDEKQLQLLSPIIKSKEKRAEFLQQKEVLDLIETQIPYYFNKIEYGLLDKEIERLEQEISFAEKDKELVSASKDRLEKERDQLITQRAAQNIDSQVSLIKKQIEIETEKMDRRRRRRDTYIERCEKLSLDTDIDEAIFRNNHTKIAQLNTTLPSEAEKLSEQRYGLKVQQDAANTKIEALQQQITSLLSRKNRIPDDLINARKRLIDILDTTEEELPFVGELIKVKASEQLWEDSIEKLLHSFSMQLLVPEKFSKAANQFIYNNDMQTKLVYHKIDRRSTSTIARWHPDEEYLINKVEIKPSGYTQWIETSLLERFDYFCTDDLDIFYNSSKAITSNGLIRNASRHEKDDRPGRWNKSKYRLGWDNRATIHYLQQQKNNEQKTYELLSEDIRKITPRINDLHSKTQTLVTLLEFEHYDDINYSQHAQQIIVLNKQQDELKKSSNAYNTIVKHLLEVEKKLTEENAKRDALLTLLSRLNGEFNKNNSRKLTLNFDDLEESGEKAIVAFLASEQISTENIQSLTQFDSAHTQAGLRHKTRLKTASDAVNNIEKDIIKFVAAFVHPEEKIIREFPDWSGDVMNIKADITGLEDLEDLHKTISIERLVEHKRRFRDYMDKSMLDSLTSYRTWLYNELDKIEDMIHDLNTPLRKITFNRNPDTYLQLESRQVRGENEITIFKNQLNAAIPNVLDFSTQKDDSYREEIFHKIKELITELKQEENWRRKVTDVRNWLKFGAKEFTISDNKAGQYHEDTASYSGGQKAQFTYAILGAAIAHQFGIFQQGKQHKSLRFITVDEAFSKLDPEKSRFLMEFCSQLNLQILVVTPLDKINIAEPYINAVHFVEIKNKKNSVLYNLTMEQYYEKKESFKQLTEDKE